MHEQTPFRMPVGRRASSDTTVVVDGPTEAIGIGFLYTLAGISGRNLPHR
jgi:hypothetical protein